MLYHINHLTIKARVWQLGRTEEWNNCYSICGI